MDPFFISFEFFGAVRGLGMRNQRVVHRAGPRGTSLTLLDSKDGQQTVTQDMVHLVVATRAQFRAVLNHCDPTPVNSTALGCYRQPRRTPRTRRNVLRADVVRQVLQGGEGEADAAGPASAIGPSPTPLPLAGSPDRLLVDGGVLEEPPRTLHWCGPGSTNPDRLSLLS
jgi:hypothetical protein